MYNKCHKIYLSGPFGDFLFYAILTISVTYGREQQKTSSLPTDSSRPLLNANRDFFWHTDCIFQLEVLSLIYARVTWVPPRNFASWSKSLWGITSFRVGKTTGHRGVIINASEIRWPGNEPEVPFSECWERCPSGSYTENYSGVCWWSCQKCPHGTYNSNSTSTLCSACPKEQMTNGLQSACVDKPLIIIKAGEFLAVIFLSACGLGEMLSLLVLGVFVRYHVTA